MKNPIKTLIQYLIKRNNRKIETLKIQSILAIHGVKTASDLDYKLKVLWTSQHLPVERPKQIQVEKVEFFAHAYKKDESAKWKLADAIVKRLIEKNLITFETTVLEDNFFNSEMVDIKAFINVLPPNYNK